MNEAKRANSDDLISTYFVRTFFFFIYLFIAMSLPKKLKNCSVGNFVKYMTQSLHCFHRHEELHCDGQCPCSDSGSEDQTWDVPPGTLDTYVYTYFNILAVTREKGPQWFVVSEHYCADSSEPSLWAYHMYPFYICWLIFEQPHDKTNKMTVCPAKTQISLGIRPVWSESSLCAQ